MPVKSDCLSLPLPTPAEQAECAETGGCGSGAIDVFDMSSDKYSRVTQIQTVAGARTGLFVPELNSLFVGVRGHWGEPPAIWIFQTVGSGS
jgi:hypothetical protein